VDIIPFFFLNSLHLSHTAIEAIVDHSKQKWVVETEDRKEEEDPTTAPVATPLQTTLSPERKEVQMSKPLSSSRAVSWPIGIFPLPPTLQVSESFYFIQILSLNY